MMIYILFLFIISWVSFWDPASFITYISKEIPPLHSPLTVTASHFLFEPPSTSGPLGVIRRTHGVLIGKSLLSGLEEEKLKEGDWRTEGTEYDTGEMHKERANEGWWYWCRAGSLHENSVLWGLAGRETKWDCWWEEAEEGGVYQAFFLFSPSLLFPGRKSRWYSHWINHKAEWESEADWQGVVVPSGTQLIFCLFPTIHLVYISSNVLIQWSTSQYNQFRGENIDTNRLFVEFLINGQRDYRWN